MIFNRIQPEIENILMKNQNSFQRNRFTASQDLTIRQIIGLLVKNLEAAQ